VLPFAITFSKGVIIIAVRRASETVRFELFDVFNCDVAGSVYSAFITAVPAFFASIRPGELNAATSLPVLSVEAHVALAVID